MNAFFKKILEKFKSLKLWQKSLIIVVLVSIIVGPFISDDKEKQLKIEQQAKIKEEEKKKLEEQKAKEEQEKKEQEEQAKKEAEEKKKQEEEQAKKEAEEKKKQEEEQAKKEAEEKKKQEEEQANSNNSNNESIEIHGNAKTKVYHLPGQASYNRISSKNLVIFHSEQEAINAGYRRAKR